jgi:hypothetical protein
MTVAQPKSEPANLTTTLRRTKGSVDPAGWIADPQDQEPYLVEARRLYRGATRLGCDRLRLRKS